MKSLIDIFRMKEINVETRINIIIQLGKAINNNLGMNITEALVYELVKALDANHAILLDKYYSQHIKESNKREVKDERR
jgi:hypothetical protein